MAIRSAAKAIILHNSKVLINKCVQSDTNSVYYDLPGGGQHQFENLEEAVVREVLEETGYNINVVRFTGIAEEIQTNEEIRKVYSDYAHRIVHIFIARLVDNSKVLPSETDFQQTESIWMDLDEADHVCFRPQQLTGKISMLVTNDIPFYFGCTYVQ